MNEQTRELKNSSMMKQRWIRKHGKEARLRGSKFTKQEFLKKKKKRVVEMQYLQN